MTASNKMLVRILRRVGDDEYKPIGDPLTYQEAISLLSRISEEHLPFLDLESVATGRLVSWVVKNGEKADG